MLVAEGCKLYTRDGFRPVESFDGKAVEVSSLPYFDMVNSLLHDPEPQEVYIEKKHTSSSSGLEGMPLHKSTNYLCASPYNEKDVDLLESAFFLNTIQTNHAGSPAIVPTTCVPKSWVDYTYKHKDYKEAVSGVMYYAAAFNQIMSNNLDEIEYSGSHNLCDFLLKTDVNVYKIVRLATKNARWPEWKFIDYDNTRLYFTENTYPELNNALISISHLIRYPFSVHDNKLKVYLPTLNLDKISKRTVTDFPRVLAINAKRKFRNKMLADTFNRKQVDRLGKDYRAMLSKGCYPGYIPSIAKYQMDIVQMMYLPPCFRIIPLKDRKATILFPKSCWLPLSFFENVTWYEVYSATPKLLFVESPSGLLFIMSTIGGNR